MTIAETARKMVAAAKRDTTTYGEALKNLGPASIEVAPGAGWSSAYDLAVQMLLNEMKALQHGGNTETAAVGATVKCFMKNCDEAGTLGLDNGHFICDNCAQIQSELAP